MILFAGSLATGLRAQTIRIKLVNGKNGHPMALRCLNLWVGDKSAPKSRPLLETQTDKNGFISIRLTTADTQVDSQSQQLACGLRGVIDPVLKYGDTVSVRAGLVWCQPGGSNYSWLAAATFSSERILQSGIVTPNACGKAKAFPTPGEVVLFVRPLTLWEKLKT